MLFNSLDFLAFFVAVFALYQLLPHVARKVLLLAASYFFYGCWDYRFLSLLLISTVVDFYCAQGISASRDAKTRRVLLSISLAVNLGFLLVFKYCDFFIGSANHLLLSLGIEHQLRLLKLILPVGISFYTFQTLSYTIDVYRGQLKPARCFLDFATFVAFFPQLVAGPIERASHFLPQLETKRSVSEHDLINGLWLVLLGFVKKLVIADRCAAMVNVAFEGNTLPYGGLGDWFFLYAFAFQIYGDFSGYTDIARGVAKMLGYDLMLNFRKPYLVSNASDFWHHWHISLSSWLRDYLYISLGGNRFGCILTYRNLTLTMLLGGLWHGAGWAYFFWGAYQGILLVAHRLMQPILKPISKTMSAGFLNPIWTFATWIVFFHLVCVGWLLFRVGSLPPEQSQLAFLQNSFSSLLQWNEIFVDPAVFRTVLLTGLLTFLIQWKCDDLERLAEWSLVKQVFAVVAAAVSITILGVFEGAEFIYFQF